MDAGLFLFYLLELSDLRLSMTICLSLTFAISDKNRQRKSKNDKKEKNVTNELVLVGRYVELRVKSHGESVAERWGAPYAGWSE